MEIVKLIASQAAVAIENSLLRNQENTQAYEYQVGGCLSVDAPTYIVRSADQQLYQAIKSGEFCYVLNARHMGKSSLRVQVMKRLSGEGMACISIDLTAIGSQNISSEQWYAALIYTLTNHFELDPQFDLLNWWQTKSLLSPSHRLSIFLREILLQQVDAHIVIFLDEIDCTLGLNFSTDEFFALIRSIYNQRADYPEYQRLSFVLLGVANASNLIRDQRVTPFNLGRAIALHPFQPQDVQPLIQGLSHHQASAEALVHAVLTWTGGQPFLTQKLCNLISKSAEAIPPGEENAWVETLVPQQIIQNWETHDDPEHLKTILNRLVRSELSTKKLLKIYRQVLETGSILTDASPEQHELLLSGLLRRQPASDSSSRENRLRVYNRIYKAVFSV